MDKAYQVSNIKPNNTKITLNHNQIYLPTYHKFFKGLMRLSISTLSFWQVPLQPRAIDHFSPHYRTVGLIVEIFLLIFQI